MQKSKFNRGWVFRNGAEDPMQSALKGTKGGENIIDLPHDAMIHEKRSEDVPSGTQSGFYPGGKYTYIKRVDIPKEWEMETLFLVFEGVYGDTKIFVNGEYAMGHHNGYTEFPVSLDKYLNYGSENEIRVEVNNSMQPNSRWYSGSGIYRDVYLLRSGALHVAPEGIKVSTPEITENGAVAVVEVPLRNESRKNQRVTVDIEISGPDGQTAGKESIPVTVYGKEGAEIRQRAWIANPLLWDCDTPNLYTCHVQVTGEDGCLDSEEVSFGIRSLALDPVHGLRINGKETKLRGACIHHDNGIIGACTLAQAEQRRCHLLKEAGFNCIRSSHHPVSRAMLEACDRNGMLVIDELTDVWNQSKNTNDYSIFFEEHWEEDAAAMVAKDFNHPSVILYSTGNEIQEISTAAAADLNRKICARLHSLDGSRYITNAINGLFAAGPTKMREIFADILSKIPGGEKLLDMGNSAEKEESQEKETGKTQEGGSNQANKAMSIMTGPLADAFAAHPVMTELIEEFASALDVTGLNYLTGRHVLEHELHPNRVVLGAETYPADIANLWNIATDNPHVIGDMTWTGWDYLGEAGIGIFYYDGRMSFQKNWPCSVAYIGDIDITGYRRPISYLREIVYGIRKEPYIAVQRVDRFGRQCNKTAWMHKDTIASWTWEGYEGKQCLIDVYSDAEEVELLLNGESLGRQSAGKENGYTAVFETQYQPGRLEAVAYRNGSPAERQELYTAEAEIHLCPMPEKDRLRADGEDLCYIPVCLKDSHDRVNMQKECRVSVEIAGPASIQGYGSACPETLEHYDDRTWTSYDGYVLAVVRAGHEPGEVTVRFFSEGMDTAEVHLQIEK